MPANVEDTALASRAVRSWGGMEARVIRGADGRTRVLNPMTGEPLGMLISEADAERFDDAELPAIEDDGLNAVRGISLGLFIVLVLLASGYALFTTGRAYERSYGTDSRWSRP